MDTATKRENKYRIDLPDDVRRKLGLPLGVEIAFMRTGRGVILTPAISVESAFGIIRGAKVDFATIRDKQDKYR
ncbi:MAG TPA: AbrB/MazE/SpoVT family DNA-binding domain-containing protein [Tepidisphaeraceae bacterium]|jgi:bifunctional DNA-binding transcriptional regulator/antitoxin component of YhaV-PrlF toxin-antitoxin module